MRHFGADALLHRIGISMVQKLVRSKHDSAIANRAPLINTPDHELNKAIPCFDNVVLETGIDQQADQGMRVNMNKAVY